VLLLLDEPLSSLDAEMRLKVRQDLRVILKASKVSALFVTHDQEEALYLGDRVAVMNKGGVEQVGTPEQIFHEPKTGFVAEFLGGSDFLPGRVTENGIETEIGVVVQNAELPVGTQVELVIRPDDVHFEPDSAAGSLILPAISAAPHIYTGCACLQAACCTLQCLTIGGIRLGRGCVCVWTRITRLRGWRNNDGW
jgi:iron(III) transport system ATP-binding protein